MNKTFIEELMSDSEGIRLYLQEGSIFDVTELISELMEAKKIKRTELANRLGKSKSQITQLLSGGVNMTIRTISDVMWALGYSLSVNASPLSLETSIESVGEFDLPTEADFWLKETIHLAPIQEREVAQEEEQSKCFKWAS